MKLLARPSNTHLCFQCELVPDIHVMCKASCSKRKVVFMTAFLPLGAISLVDSVTGKLEPIRHAWEEFARSLVPLAGLDRARSKDHAAAILVAIVINMGAYQSESGRSGKAG